MLNRRERRGASKRWSATLAEAERDMRRAQALAQAALQRIVGKGDAQDALRPELEAISAQVRQVGEMRAQNETVEGLLLAGRQTAEWAAQLIQAAQTVLQAHPAAPGAHRQEVVEIQQGAQVLIRLLKKRGLAAPDVSEGA